MYFWSTLDQNQPKCSPCFALLLQTSHIFNLNAGDMPDLSCCPWHTLNSWTPEQCTTNNVLLSLTFTTHSDKPKSFSLSSIFDILRRTFLCIESGVIIIHQYCMCVHFCNKEIYSWAVLKMQFRPMTLQVFFSRRI